MAGFIGNKPGAKYASLTRQTFSSPTGTSHTLSQTVTNSDDLLLYINNVKQNPADYTASGTTLTTSSLAGGTEMYCLYYGKTTETVAPPASSVGDSHIVDMASSKLTGALPAISGASLTNLPVTGWEYVSSASASGGTSVEFTNMVIGYDYEYVLDNIHGDDNGAGFYLHLGVAGPTYRTSTYDCVVTEVSTHVSGGEIQARADTNRIDILDNAESALGTGTNEALHIGKLFLNNPVGTSNETAVMGTVVNFGSDPATAETRTHHIAGFYKTAEAHPCIKFIANSGNLSSGTFLQYRRKRS